VEKENEGGDWAAGRKRREGRWAAGWVGKGVWGFFFFFFQILFNKIFKPFQIQIFTQLFSKLFTNIFTIILKDLSQILLKTFKTTPQPKLMHSKMMRKHLGDSNY
jgi:hypothetical protein